MEASVRPLAGDNVPAHVDVPAELVLRRSCGCEQAQGRTNVRSAFHEGLDLLFHQQKLRMATQALLRDRKPSQWDQRVGDALKRMGIAWAAVLEWPVGLVPANWAGQEFRRLAVYENGVLSEAQTRQSPQASVLSEVLSSQCEPIIVEPLVNGERFHGLLLLRHVHGMEQTYDTFAPLLAAAWSGSFAGAD